MPDNKLEGNEETPKPQAGEEKPQGENQDAPEEKPEDEPEGGGSQSIDYKAELEREKERRIKAEKVIEKRKKIEKEEEPIEPTLTQEEIDERIEQKVDERLEEKMAARDRPRAEMMARELASSEDEAKLIMHHFDSSIKHTDNLLRDMENAQALANKGRLTAINRELKRSLKSKETAGTGAGAGQKPESGAPEPRLSAADKEFVVKFGGKWDPKRGEYKIGDEYWKPGS